MVNWSIAQQPNAFERAFESGFQRGEYVRQRGEQEAQRNALAGYATNPSDETFNALAQVAPEYAIQVRGQRDAAAQEAAAREMRSRAAQGDPAALAELAGVDLNAWRGLNTDQRTQLNEAATVLGNVAMQISQLPEEQRAAAWDAQVDQLSGRFPSIASERGQYSPDNLAATINEAGMFQQFYQAQQPDYMAIPEGGTLVNTRDPAAISQFGGQGGGMGTSVPTGSPLSPPPPQQSRGTIFPIAQWGAYVRANGAALPAVVERDRPVIVNSQGVQVQTDVINGQIAYNVNGVWYDNPEGQ